MNDIANNATVRKQMKINMQVSQENASFLLSMVNKLKMCTWDTDLHKLHFQKGNLKNHSLYRQVYWPYHLFTEVGPEW